MIEFIPILRDDRVHEDDGRYNLDVETANGISMSSPALPTVPTAPSSRQDNTHHMILCQNSYTQKHNSRYITYQCKCSSYTAPDGSLIEIKIAFAAEEDAARERAEAQASAPAPTTLYGQPQ
nr:uncharacterized protein LOC113830181 [Penaeus vannamei]